MCKLLQIEFAFHAVPMCLSEVIRSLGSKGSHLFAEDAHCDQRCKDAFDRLPTPGRLQGTNSKNTSKTPTGHVGFNILMSALDIKEHCPACNDLDNSVQGRLFAGEVFDTTRDVDSTADRRVEMATWHFKSQVVWSHTTDSSHIGKSQANTNSIKTLCLTHHQEHRSWQPVSKRCSARQY